MWECVTGLTAAVLPPKQPQGAQVEDLSVFRGTQAA